MRTPRALAAAQTVPIACDVGANITQHLELARVANLPRDREQRLMGLARVAVRYDMAVVFANYGGATAGMTASGGSTILSQNGVRLCELGATGRGVAIALEDASGWRAHAVMI